MGLYLAILAVFAGTTASADVTHFLQISDLHLSKYGSWPQEWNYNGDREADLNLLAATVVAGMQPRAILVTGDLADSKEHAHRGRQLTEEWQANKQVQARLAEAAGCGLDLVLDLRGNHDNFNVPHRNGAEDLFHTVSRGWQNATSRVCHTALPAAAACPALVLLGVDTAPSPGLRGPSDFFGMATDSLLAELDATLHTLGLALRQCDPQPPVVAYGHYPLGLTTYGLAPGQRGADSALSIMLRHEVAVFLSGHLHSSLGQRSHHIYRTPTHGVFAELETAAWKDARRFRLLAVDSGHLSFADYYLQTPSRPSTPSRSSASPLQRHHNGTSFAITAEDQTVAVGDFFMLITYPPDARYSVHHIDTKGPVAVRALVLPAVAGAGLLPQDAEVWMQWNTEQSGSNKVPLAPTTDSPAVFAGVVPSEGLGPASRGVLQLQVFARLPSSKAPTSASARRPAQYLAGAGGVRPLPLTGQSLLERYGMALDWPTLACRLYYLGLCGLWCCLLVPWALVRSGQACRLQLWLTSHKAEPWGVLLAYLAWPLLKLIDMARFPALLLPQIVYALNLTVGVWFVGRALSTQPLALFLAGHVLVHLDGSWRLLQVPEQYTVGCFTLAGVALPLTLWTAALTSYMSKRQQKHQQQVSREEEIMLVARESSTGSSAPESWQGTDRGRSPHSTLLLLDTLLLPVLQA
ncbi:hypothetical protein WJX73_001391 [Symbiochloris irregularis]|uniref:Calcineurin-like phosphoesterase domain-containing protein n=1 Tax=Symbiochloris irregularis TaxID=706552 RepID=A0AAW1NW87_9CHLO